MLIIYNNSFMLRLLGQFYKYILDLCLMTITVHTLISNQIWRVGGRR